MKSSGFFYDEESLIRAHPYLIVEVLCHAIEIPRFVLDAVLVDDDISFIWMSSEVSSNVPL